jgi:hypothetical protein
MREKVQGKFDDCHFGALKGRSTTHELVHICHQAADNHQSARAVFTDFAEVFDHIDHSVALSRDDCHWCTTVCHPLDEFTCSFLIVSYKKIGNFKSNWTALNGGVPLGT